jgi:hypothetical protein
MLGDAEWAEWSNVSIALRPGLRYLSTLKYGNSLRSTMKAIGFFISSTFGSVPLDLAIIR